MNIYAENPKNLQKNSLNKGVQHGCRIQSSRRKVSHFTINNNNWNWK